MARTKNTARKAAGAAPRARQSQGGKAPRHAVGGKAMPRMLANKAATAGTQKPRRRYRPGTKAMREIRKLQTTIEMVIPRLPFQRLVREITQNVTSGPTAADRWTPQALAAMQEAAEHFLVHHFEASMLQTAHADRITVMAKDSKAVCNQGKLNNVPIYRDMSTSDGRLSESEQAQIKKNIAARKLAAKQARAKKLADAAAAAAEARPKKAASVPPKKRARAEAAAASCRERV